MRLSVWFFCCFLCVLGLAVNSRTTQLSQDTNKIVAQIKRTPTDLNDLPPASQHRSTPFIPKQPTIVTSKLYLSISLSPSIANLYLPLLSSFVVLLGPQRRTAQYQIKSKIISKIKTTTNQQTNPNNNPKMLRAQRRLQRGG